MKKTLISMLIATTMVFSFVGFGGRANASVSGDGYLKTLITTAEESKIEKSTQKTDIGSGDTYVYWGENENKSPRFIDGKLNEEAINNKDDVLKYVEENKDAFGLQTGDFQLKDEIKDDQGNTHYKVKLMKDGIDVRNKILIVHVNNDGNIYNINADIDSTLENVNFMEKVKISEADAIKIAEDSLEVKNNQANYTYTPTAQLFVDKLDGQWRTVFMAEIIYNDPSPANWSIFVDASTGEVLKTQNKIMDLEGSGTGLDGKSVPIQITKSGSKYQLSDSTRSSRGVYTTHDSGRSTYRVPGTIVQNSTTNFNAGGIMSSAVSAHYNVAKAADYYKNTFGRDSWDGKGAGITASVNVGRSYLNAYFDGRGNLAFGEGDKVNAAPFAGCLDIVAHEFTHAVTSSTADLAYENQSGALNESFSDVFGLIIEGDNTLWEMGDNLQLPTSRYVLKRSAKDPTMYGQPAHMKDYENLPNTQDGDWGGVHTNSGIPNKAFYNIASKIGFDKAGKIYYKALTENLSATSNFMDARNALVAAAVSLYGSDSQERQIVQQGFADVGLGQAYQNEIPQ